MNNDYQILIAAIATACTISTAEAEENLHGTITHLQELKLENDFRSRDLADECEGLLGKRYDKLFFAYATEKSISWPRSSEAVIPFQMRSICLAFISATLFFHFIITIWQFTPSDSANICASSASNPAHSPVTSSI